MPIATPTAALASIASGRASSQATRRNGAMMPDASTCSILRQLIHARLRIGATFGARVVD